MTASRLDGFPEGLLDRGLAGPTIALNFGFSDRE
jgi:hypothetical protein